MGKRQLRAMSPAETGILRLVWQFGVATGRGEEFGGLCFWWIQAIAARARGKGPSDARTQWPLILLGTVITLSGILLLVRLALRAQPQTTDSTNRTRHKTAAAVLFSTCVGVLMAVLRRNRHDAALACGR